MPRRIARTAPAREPAKREARFAAAVWRLVGRVPSGRVVTYGELARLLGRPRAARAVGRALAGCPPDLPWHRVVNARGGISRRARTAGMVTQRLRLEAEGIAVRGGRVALPRHRWPARSR